MMKRQAVAAAIGAVVWSTGAGADTLADMTACAGVGSASVRLACYDAAAKTLGGTAGPAADIGACAKVSTATVRLACFDAAAGKAPAAIRTTQSAEAEARTRALAARQAELDRLEVEAARAAAAAKTEAAQKELNQWDAQLRAREAAVKARMEAAEKEAAAARERAGAAELPDATAAKQTAGEFGGKYLKEDKETEEFGTPGDLLGDPLTAKTYGRSAEQKQEQKKKTDKNRTRSGKLKSITVKITNIRKGPHGKIRVTLENGQVWKQIDSSHARYNKKGDNVARIRRAVLGSFLMTINDKGAAIRVRRVK